MCRRHILVLAAAFFVAAPLLHALAAGPLVYLHETGRPLLSDETFQALYYPLIRAEARIPPLDRAMHWYVGLWRRAPQRADGAIAD
jgi:hypothetical protein